MNVLKKILESTVRIQYQDCDPFNHLNNSKYIDYIVAARTEQLLENYAFNTAETAQTDGLGWVAAQTQISYLYPAVWLEKVVIETKLISFSESSLWVEAFMWNENKTHIKAIMWSKLVHFNIKLQKSHKHSKELMQFFEQIHHPLQSNFTFENRVSALKKEYEKKSIYYYGIRSERYAFKRTNIYIKIKRIGWSGYQPSGIQWIWLYR